MKVRVYISGKISGLTPEIAEANFKSAEEMLKKKDPSCVVVNPYAMCEKIFKNKPEANWLDRMNVCIKMLVKCNVVYLLPTWTTSDGAIIECMVAKHENIQIVYDPDKFLNMRVYSDS